jgi:sulfur-carrier protein
VAVLRLFAQAREAAGSGRETFEGATVDEVLAAARARYGEEFAALLPTCRIWVNGEPALGNDPVAADDEVAVLPPVSGGGS